MIEETVIQPESVTSAEQPVAETPSQPTQPTAPNLDSLKAEYEAQIAAARKEAAEAQEAAHQDDARDPADLRVDDGRRLRVRAARLPAG